MRRARPSSRASLRASRKTRDHELIAGSAAHYEDAAYYASTYDKRTEDVALYTSIASKLAGQRHGDVLEYGCGNGRITIPIARVLSGTQQIVGVDLSPTMLADARARLANEDDRVSGRVVVKRGDMRKVKLRRTFGLVICPFNAFLHLYTRDDVERFLARVRAHLAPNGRFVFDVSIPMPGDLGRDPDRAYGAPRLRHPTTGQLVRYQERFDYDALRQILFVTSEFEPVDGAPPFAVPLAHRQFFPEELSMLLHYNGFEVESLVGGFEGEALTRHSDQMVVTARVRGR